MAIALQTNQGGNHALPHILVMEDEVSIANGLKTVLTEEGYNVDLAKSGREALEVMRKSQFHLLVADLRLPDISGIDVIKEVKKKWPSTEVVVITGYPSVSSAVTAMKLGSRNYLPKPFTEDEIVAAIDEALASYYAQPSEQLIQKETVSAILNRTLESRDFWAALMENGSEVLDEYQLSDEAKAAIVSGDIQWIEKNVGPLSREQLSFIYQRLEREAW